MHQPKNKVLKYLLNGKFIVPFLVPGNVMVPIVKLGLRSHNQRMSITASGAAILWFQSWQYYPSTDMLHKHSNPPAHKVG